MFKRLTSLILITGLGACSGKKLDPRRNDPPTLSAKATLDPDSLGLRLKIRAGKLRGVEAWIPREAHKEGYVYELRSPSYSLDSFAVIPEAEQISAPIELSIEDSNQKEITQLGGAYTLKIPIETPEVVSLSASDEDRICVLSNIESGLYIWRRWQLRIIEGYIELESVKAGAFQAFKCPYEDLANFRDPFLASLGRPSLKPIANMIFTWDRITNLLQQELSLCTGIWQQRNGQKAFLGLNKQNFSDLREQKIEFWPALEFNLQELGDNEILYVSAFFLPKGGGCTPKHLSQNQTKPMSYAYHYAKKAAELKAQTLSGQLSEISGPYPLRSLNLSLGSTSNASVARAGPNPLCLQSLHREAKTQSFVEHYTDIGKNNTIDQNSSLTVFFIPAEDEAFNPTLKLSYGAYDCSLSGTDIHSKALFSEPKNNLVLSPLEFSFDLSSDLKSRAPYFCLRIFPSSSGAEFLGESEKEDLALASTVVQASAADQSKFLFVDSDKGANFDLGIKILNQKGTCQSAGTEKISPDLKFGVQFRIEEEDFP